MKHPKSVVVLFEDDPDTGPKVAKAIQAALPKGIVLARFDDRLPKKPQLGAYEDLLFTQLQGKSYAGLALVVTDRDLSRSQRYPGLSEAVVSKVAARLGVPVCIYAAGQLDSVLRRQRSGGDARIILDSADRPEMGRRIASIAEGFVQVADALTDPPIVRLHRKARGPAIVLAHILNRPEIADRLSLYATGDQKMIAELMPVDGTGAEPAGIRRKRLPTILGYWLYDSVLRFPGLVVNSTAAASYLNIDEATFESSAKIREVFKEALYKGPFADPGEPRWWRDLLDDLLQKKKATDGRTLVARVLKREVKPCYCSLDHKTRAGFYCVISGTPVSKANSTGQISWLPRGADLARVRQDLFDELAPWIGFS